MTALFVRRRWSKVTAVVAIAAAIAALVVLATRHRTPETTGSPDTKVLETASLPPEPTPSPLPLATVLARPASYAGRAVAATSVEVRSVVSPSAVWVGASPAERVLVLVVSADTSFAGLPAGSRLTFTGTVQVTTTAFADALGLSPSDRALLVRQGAFVEVTGYTTG